MAIEESLDKLKSQERPTDKEEDRERQKNGTSKISFRVASSKLSASIQRNYWQFSK